MLGVVITGGANGVGWAYADEFLARKHSVIICDIKDPEAAVAALKRKHPSTCSGVSYCCPPCHHACPTHTLSPSTASDGDIHGLACDVGDTDAVDKLGEFAQEKLGTIHYWINNAGINGGRRSFDSLGYKTIEAVVKVNLLGTLYCTQVALKIMKEQKETIGHIFNTVGSGVKGGGTPGYVVYGATKRGLPQMTDSLVAELEKGVQGYQQKKAKGDVRVHTLSPGMVFTQLLLDDSTPELRKFPFGVLAAQPEEVAQDLVPKILGVQGNGQKVEFLTTDKILTAFYRKFILGEQSQYAILPHPATALPVLFFPLLRLSFPAPSCPLLFYRPSPPPDKKLENI